MANVVRKWKRWMAVGCTHGRLMCRPAWENVLKFRAEFKPHVRVHLGDFCDQTAWMSGGNGTANIDENIEDDISAGASTLSEFEPTTIFLGNHDERPWRYKDHKNKVTAFAARQGIAAFEGLAKELKAELVPYDIDAGWRRPCGSDMVFGHGYMHNMNALRDHAETFGKCAIAHLHVPGQENGRRSDHPTAWCCGTLAQIPAMSYAKTNRNRMRWGLAFIWGHCTSNQTIVNIANMTRAGEMVHPT